MLEGIVWIIEWMAPRVLNLQTANAVFELLFDRFCCLDNLSLFETWFMIDTALMTKKTNNKTAHDQTIEDFKQDIIKTPT